ncbi:MAG: hypothetical protein KKI08_28170 [Armatimonadetes bacterium]|nr:hypothetical protein [Armatimonadota bacterium]
MPRKRPPRPPGVSVRPGGQKAYPRALIAQVRTAWASGEFAGDYELCEAFGLPRPETIAGWRKEGAPDGVPWEEVRARMSQASLDVVAQRLGESNAEATIRHLKIVRAAETTVAKFIFGQRLTLQDGTVFTIPSVEPKSLGEAVHSYCELLKVERHLRGEPDVRVDYYLHLVGEIVGATAMSFIAELGLPEAKVNRFEEMFQERLQAALANQPTKLLTEGDWQQPTQHGEED